MKHRDYVLKKLGEKAYQYKSTEALIDESISRIDANEHLSQASQDKSQTFELIKLRLKLEAEERNAQRKDRRALRLLQERLDRDNLELKRERLEAHKVRYSIEL